MWAWGFCWEGMHDYAQEIHELASDVTILMIVAHIGFHLWRHFLLKDNALRIIVPKPLHKYL